MPSRDLATSSKRTGCRWRVELHRPGRGWVDLHPLTFDHRGHGTQAGPDGAVFRYPRESFVRGSLDGVEVAHLPRELLLAFREDYELGDVDRHDLALLQALAPTGAPPTGRGSPPVD